MAKTNLHRCTCSKGSGRRDSSADAVSKCLPAVKVMICKYFNQSSETLIWGLHHLPSVVGATFTRHGIRLTMKGTRKNSRIQWVWSLTYSALARLIYDMMNRFSIDTEHWPPSLSSCRQQCSYPILIDLMSFDSISICFALLGVFYELLQILMLYGNIRLDFGRFLASAVFLSLYGLMACTGSDVNCGRSTPADSHYCFARDPSSRTFPTLLRSCFSFFISLIICWVQIVKIINNVWYMGRNQCRRNRRIWQWWHDDGSIHTRQQNGPCGNMRVLRKEQNQDSLPHCGEKYLQCGRKIPLKLGWVRHLPDPASNWVLEAQHRWFSMLIDRSDFSKCSCC